ncbi:hypothetical protein [Agriterribacter sp.]|uniref:hypothetical protein n=1 Tax=Agriterribacter sp. TaxID=2821509 RepID=UPI002B54C6C7|nr:hypothetical protein [Agriterribacter sp.]HTN08861.1 hypothetical protein [Agriterribacter sp.]
MITSNLQQKMRYVELIYALNSPVDKSYKPWTGGQDRPAFVKVAKYKPTPKSKKRSLK